MCALFAGVFRYVDDHFHTPEIFLENTLELADNADIRERLFSGFRDEIIRLADGEVEEEASSGLDSLFSDDASADGSDPVTEERIARDQAIEEILLDVFDSDLYRETFTAALTSTQQQIIRSADLASADLLRDKGEIFFNMRQLYPVLYQRMAADERTAAITQNEVPAEYGIFKVGDRDTTVNVLWSFIRNGPSWRTLTFAVAILSLIGAVAIAERRPSRAIQFGGGMVGVGVVVIVIVYLIRFVVPLLAGGGSSASPVVATYSTNLWPLIRVMIRLVIFGVILAAVGGIAKLIWPDDWVYSSVSDDRGVRSIRRRRGEPEPEAQQQPAAAAVPVGYPGYPQQPYPGYPPQQWGQPYPGQYPPGYVAPYPVGPYAQPAQPLPQHYASPGRPTVPVMPVSVDGKAATADALEPPAAPPLDPADRPADAAQIVPRVVATAGTTLDANADAAAKAAAATSSADQVETDANESADAPSSGADTATGDQDDAVDKAIEVADEWATEKDW